MKRPNSIGEFLLAAMAMAAIFLGDPALVRGQAAANQNEAPADDAVSQLMETTGLLAGLQLYQTYLNVGFLADGKAEGIYEEQDVKQLLGSILTPLDTVDKQLARVHKFAPSKEDGEALARLSNLAGLLRRQGKALETFWASGKEADGAKYETLRKDAWGQISELLGLDEPSTP